MSHLLSFFFFFFFNDTATTEIYTLSLHDALPIYALAAVWAPQVLAIAAPFSHILGPSTTFGKDLMARIARLLGAPQVSDIMAIDSATRFCRPDYAGNPIPTVGSSRAGQLVGTVRPGS